MYQQTFQQAGYQGAAGQKYQPTGFVQSYYNNPNQSAQGFGQNQQQPQGYVQNQSAQGFRGQPFQAQGFQQFQAPQGGYYGQTQTPQSFHTTAYKGNQPNHDQFQRADSVNPAGQQTWGGQQGYGAQTQFRAPIQQFQQQPFNPNAAYGNPIQQQQQQAFHTASYQGNQPNHDQFQRADSIQPNNSHIGIR